MRPAGGFGGLLAAPGTAGGLVLFAAGASITATAARASQEARQLPGFGNPDGHAYVPAAGRAANTSHPTQVIGKGTPGSCTSAAVVGAVAEGGIITFNCGPKPVTIALTATAKVMNTTHQIVLDGGGLVTLSGGGSGGAIYTDGDNYTVTVIGSAIHDNHAREGGGAIFFVVNNNQGTLTIKNSALRHNLSDVFWTRPYPGIYFHSSGHPIVSNSVIS